MFTRPTLFLSLWLISSTVAQQTKPVAEQAFTGLICRDEPVSGAIRVGWLLPGPLWRADRDAAVIAVDDLILEVAGQKMSAKQMEEFVAQAKPGDELTLKVQRMKGKPGAKETDGAARDLKFKLACRADWGGPIHFPRPGAPRDWEKILPAAVDPVEQCFLAQVKSNDLTKVFGDVERQLFQTIPTNGFNSLSRVEYVFAHPTRLPRLAGMITQPLGGVKEDPRQVLPFFADNLDVARPKLAEKADLSKPEAALDEAVKAVAAAQALVDQALAGVGADVPQNIEELLSGLERKLFIKDHPDPVRMIGTLRASMSVNYDLLLEAGGVLAGYLSKGTAATGKEIPLPEELAKAVTGSVLAARKVEGRWYVYGSTESNRYDLAAADFAVIFDAGGDDVYEFRPRRQRPYSVQVIVDCAGDDQHIATNGGVAAGFFGVSLLADWAGHDKYTGSIRSCGAGIFGIGVLLDYEGNDEYVASAWSQGAAFYGAGAILDLNGSDVFTSSIYSQGVGGPRGVGLIFKDGGQDLYRANGPVKSVYRTPAVYYACSQGVGFGMRQYETGGIGIIEDTGGDDRYEAGEFAQGGAYYQGLGILHDGGGNDLYHGSRYAQGFGCHSAHGILMDDAGDDMYYILQYGAQGSGWDLSVGMLVDRSGNDCYQGADLAQGSAAMQGLAWMIDLGGQDRYIGGGSSQGLSGGNSYHYAESGAFSFSFLLDVGGAEDYYSTQRGNNQIKPVAIPNEKSPGDGNVYGIFMDVKQLNEPMLKP